MKKLLAMTMSLFLLTAMLSGCGKTETPTGGEVNNPTASNSQTEDTNADSDKDAQQQSSTNSTKSSTSTSAAKPSSTSTSKPSSTNKTEKSSSTKKPASKPSSTKKQTQGKSKYEISASGVKTVSGATVQRAWKVSENGVSAEIHRVAYGPKITQAFDKSNADSAINVNKTITYQPVCTLAIVTCSPENIGMASSQSLLGTTTGTVEAMAKKKGALIAVNGEAGSTYSTGRRFSIVRNGKLVTNYTDNRPAYPLLIYKDGTWKFDQITSSNSAQRIKDGVWNTVRYQFTLVNEGKVAYTQDEGYYHNRTAIAQISPDKYIIAVSEFMPLTQMAKLLAAYGAQTAVVLNGGNCTSMYVKGIGNTTGTNATQLKVLNKVNVLETEFFGRNGMLGANSAGQQKLGAPCKELDIFYVK